MNKSIRFFIFSIAVIVLIITGCHRRIDPEFQDGEGARLWFEPVPDGMVYVKGGSFSLGSDNENLQGQTGQIRTVSVAPFWMDETEITNNQYRQFTTWVRDSIARTILAQKFPEFSMEENSDNSNTEEPKAINWDREIDWKNPEYREALEEMFVPDHERYMRKREIDARKLTYILFHVNLQEAARSANSYDYEKKTYHGTVVRSGKEVPVTDRSVFLTKEVVPVYPDTLCWVRDFTYSYNEPLTKSYFSNRGFNDYPVVGVTWKQAKAFCDWRTKLKERYLNQRRNNFDIFSRIFKTKSRKIYESPFSGYRLPTEAEWEYAARGGIRSSQYPWGGNYTRSPQGCFLANFKPLRGRYASDNRKSCVTSRVGYYDPNNYGLYDMAGNVSEWTETAYNEATYSYINDLNPNMEYNASASDSPVLKRKVIRGGSWKDVEYYIRVSTRSYEYQDSAKSYIGFRCVMSSMGGYHKR